MKKISMALGLLLIVFTACVSSEEVPEITPQQAFQMVEKESTYLIDVRSIAEYVFIGHPEMAYNVPLSFWSDMDQAFVPNQNFVEDIKKRFNAEDKLIFICRSGGRSMRAAQLMNDAGYTSVFSVNEGFEGRTDEDGYRTLEGWKNRDLPYVYDQKEELRYKNKN